MEKRREVYRSGLKLIIQRNRNRDIRISFKVTTVANKRTKITVQ